MDQNYANHRRWVPMYHFVLFTITVLSLVGSLVNLYKTCDAGHGLYDASLIVMILVAVMMTQFYARLFALKAQDRAIRAEENLRHYAMTGKLLDPKLTVRQIIGLRFAADDEWLALMKRALDENLGEEEIKKAIKNWKGDYYRV